MVPLTTRERTAIAEAFQFAIEGGPVVFTTGPTAPEALYATRPVPDATPGQIVDELQRLADRAMICIHLSIMDGEIAFFLH